MRFKTRYISKLITHYSYLGSLQKYFFLYLFVSEKAEVTIEGMVASGAKYLQFSNKKARVVTPGVAKTYFKRTEKRKHLVFFFKI